MSNELDWWSREEKNELYKHMRAQGWSAWYSAFYIALMSRLWSTRRHRGLFLLKLLDRSLLITMFFILTPLTINAPRYTESVFLAKDGYVHWLTYLVTYGAWFVVNTLLSFLILMLFGRLFRLPARLIRSYKSFKIETEMLRLTNERKRKSKNDSFDQITLSAEDSTHTKRNLDSEEYQGILNDDILNFFRESVEEQEKHKKE
jgi:hypothetical protein